MFTDPFFPPNDYSIHGDKRRKEYQVPLVWRRVEEFIRGLLSR